MSITAPTHARRRLGIFAVVAALAAGTATAATTASAAAPPTISDADVQAAGLGVLTFTLRNASADPITEPCPTLTQEQLGWYMGQNGFTPNFNGFFVDVYREADVGEGYFGVDCGVDIGPAVDAPDPAAPHYPVVGAAHLGDGVTFEQYLSQLEGSTVLTPSVPGIGGEIGGLCVEASPGFCYLSWHRGPLVVTLIIAGGTGDVTRARVEPMLISMVPDVVANLKAASTDPAAPPVTTAAPATTAAPPVTTAAVPATTAAVPATTVAVPATTVAVPATTVAVPATTVAVPATTVAVPATTVAVPATTVAVPATTAAPATTTAIPATTAPGGDVPLPAGYTMITDSSGRLTVAVPAAWVVDGAPLTLDDGTQLPRVVASTDVEAYMNTFAVPGVEMLLLPFVAGTATAVTDLGLDAGNCTSNVTEPYSDPVFTGHIGHWTGCGAGSASWHLVVASPADQSATVAVIIQMTGPQDQAILDTALASFNLLPGGTTTATTVPAAPATTAAVPAPPTTVATAPTTTVPG